MSTLIGIADSMGSQHRDALASIAKQTNGTVRIASAYVTDTQLLSGMNSRDVRLLAYLTRQDIVVGASSLDSLATLLEAGVRCRFVSSEPRLHAKVYLFGDDSAVVTSANLTKKALDSNVEVGVQLSGVEARQLISWFDLLWDKADELDLEIVSKWHQDTKADRAEYSSRWKTVAKQPLIPASAATTLVDLFKTAKRLFICNTNRKFLPEAEKRMHDLEYAAAWEDFHYPARMDEVRQGDLIFAYKNGVGIIGVGRANGIAQKLESGDPDRVVQTGTPEWRVPTSWLAWTENQAYKGWNVTRGSFLKVRDDRQLRKEVEKYFMGIKQPSQ